MSEKAGEGQKLALDYARMITAHREEMVNILLKFLEKEERDIINDLLDSILRYRVIVSKKNLETIESTMSTTESVADAETATGKLERLSLLSKTHEKLLHGIGGVVADDSITNLQGKIIKIKALFA